MNKVIKFLGLLVVACTLPLISFSQITTGEVTGSEINTIQSVVPFLTIAPDSRSGAMGDVGVATTPDLYSLHWNPAKYAFIDGDGGVGLSYSPWLRNLVPDINLAYLTGYKRLDDKQVISGSLLYFSLGNIVFTDYFGHVTRNFNPNEFAVDLAYSRKFAEKFSGAIAFRYIYSNLTGGSHVGGTETKPGISFAADVSSYFEDDIQLFDRDSRLAFGIDISNIGSKMTYTADQEPDFIPINLRLGSALIIKLDNYNSITFAADINKLLVPTPPIYDSTGIIKGKDPLVSVPVGMLQSFYDAPNGFKEELHEITYSFGIEYWYSQQFAVRAGYFHEHATKGNRKFFTAGLGLRLNIFSLDFAYLIPTTQNHPLARTLRFSLTFDFDSFRLLNKSSN
ncbi:hypothetical protein ES705_22655 [subsurface metagenome]